MGVADPRRARAGQQCLRTRSAVQPFWVAPCEPDQRLYCWTEHRPETVVPQTRRESVPNKKKHTHTHTYTIPHLTWLRAPGGLSRPPGARRRRARRGGHAPAKPPTPHFYRRALGRPGPPQPLTFIDRAQPSLAWANPSLLLANPSLLLAGPDPSFLLAGLGQVRARWGWQGLAASGALGGGKVG